MRGVHHSWFCSLFNIYHSLAYFFGLRRLSDELCLNLLINCIRKMRFWRSLNGTNTLLIFHLRRLSSCSVLDQISVCCKVGAFLYRLVQCRFFLNHPNTSILFWWLSWFNLSFYTLWFHFHGLSTLQVLRSTCIDLSLLGLLIICFFGCSTWEIWNNSHLICLFQCEMYGEDSWKHSHLFSCNTGSWSWTEPFYSQLYSC